MRSIPVDADRVRLVSTGVVSPVQMWVELADGSRRPDPNGRQDVDEQGRALWRVEVIAPADEGDERSKTGVLEVTVASKDRPDAGGFGDLLRFDELTMGLPYVNRRTGQMTTPRFTATGVRKQGGHKQQPAAA